MSTDKSSPDVIVLPAQLSRDWLFQLYSNAYFDVELDSDGDICIRDGFRIWVFPIREGEQIRFMSQFRANPMHELIDRLQYANRINDELHFIRCYVDRDGDIGFDSYLIVSGGVTRRNIVFATRAFIDHVRAALVKDDTDVIA
jgi:hypothetical protein